MDDRERRRFLPRDRHGPTPSHEPPGRLSLTFMVAPSFEFGLLLHTRHLVRGDDGSGGLEEFWEDAQLAETAGVDHLWLGDSPRLSMLDRAHADCLTVMAALAVKTRRGKNGTAP